MGHPNMNQTGKRVALYARVSTKDQNLENQLLLLRAWASRAGHDIVAEFADDGVSGKRDRRPALNRLCATLTRREADLVAVVALDRVGRNLKHLVTLLAEWEALGVGLYSAREAVDTTTPAGRALMQMAGVFAEFEAALVSERTKAGIERARAQGKRLGRPPLPDSIQRRIELMLTQGQSQGHIRRSLMVGSGSITRVKRRMEAVGTL